MNNSWNLVRMNLSDFNKGFCDQNRLIDSFFVICFLLAASSPTMEDYFSSILWSSTKNFKSLWKSLFRNQKNAALILPSVTFASAAHQNVDDIIFFCQFYFHHHHRRFFTVCRFVSHLFVYLPSVCRSFWWQTGWLGCFPFEWIRMWNAIRLQISFLSLSTCFSFSSSYDRIHFSQRRIRFGWECECRLHRHFRSTTFSLSMVEGREFVETFRFESTSVVGHHRFGFDAWNSGRPARRSRKL